MKDNLEDALTTAFQLAKKKCDKHENKCFSLSMSDGKKHNDRSKAWIKFLARELLKMTQASHPVTAENILFRSFYRNNSNKVTAQIFNLNEFLFDIVIAQMIEINSASHSKVRKLQAIKYGKWIVESEFQINNSRALLLDLNKLAIAKSENKLFIMSHSNKNTMKNWVIKTAKELMDTANENVYLAVVPHPQDWTINDKIEVEKIT